MANVLPYTDIKKGDFVVIENTSGPLYVVEFIEGDVAFVSDGDGAETHFPLWLLEKC